MAENKDSLLMALEAMKPYLPDLVISGGWVPFIYHTYLGTPRPKHPPLLTEDLDISIAADLWPGSRPPLSTLLDHDRRSGIPLGNFGPKGPEETVYKATKDGVEIEVTFMSPRRGGEERQAIAVPAGVIATLLRYIDVLLASNMKVRIADQTLRGQAIDIQAIVATPEAYCFQKGLSFVERATRYKKGKDLHYLFDLLAYYPELRRRCEAEIPKLQARFHPKWYARFLSNLDKHFETAESEGAMLVEEQRPGGGSDPVFRAQVCRTFQDFVRNLSSARPPKTWKT